MVSEDISNSEGDRNTISYVVMNFDMIASSARILSYQTDPLHSAILWGSRG